MDDLVTALSSMPGPEVTGISDVSVDGYSGKKLTITAPDSFVGCATGPDGYTIWQLPLGANRLAAGQSFELSILDVAGTRLVIVSPRSRRTPTPTRPRSRRSSTRSKSNRKSFLLVDADVAHGLAGVFSCQLCGASDTRAGPRQTWGRGGRWFSRASSARPESPPPCRY